MLRRVLHLVLLVLALYAGVCLLAALLQERLIYLPGGPPELDPRALGLAHEDVRLRAADGVGLHAWWLPAPAARGAVLVCHGNAGSIEHRVPLAQSFLGMGLSVLLLDYRGYGRSEGAPGEEGTYLDAVAAHDHLTGERGIPPARLVAFGESLGGAVAIELARRRPLAAVVVESAFTSIPDVGRLHYPWLPVRLLARIRYDNLAKLPGLHVPLLLLHSPHDEIVPFSHAERLAAARPGTELLRTSGGHNAGGHLQRSAWRARVAEFLHAALEG